MIKIMLRILKILLEKAIRNKGFIENNMKIKRKSDELTLEEQIILEGLLQIPPADTGTDPEDPVWYEVDEMLSLGESDFMDGEP